MALNPNVSVILPQDGIRAEDASFYTMIPRQSVTGLDVCKDPIAGAWVALTAYPQFNKLGYLAVQQDDTGTKFRIVTTDHPDGG